MMPAQLPIEGRESSQFMSFPPKDLRGEGSSYLSSIASHLQWSACRTVAGLLIKVSRSNLKTRILSLESRHGRPLTQRIPSKGNADGDVQALEYREG